MSGTYISTCKECGAEFQLKLSYEPCKNGAGFGYVSGLKTCVHMFKTMGIAISWKNINDPETTQVAGPL
jgi:hypothetical protein